MFSKSAYFETFKYIPTAGMGRERWYRGAAPCRKPGVTHGGSLLLVLVAGGVTAGRILSD